MNKPDQEHLARAVAQVQLLRRSAEQLRNWGRSQAMPAVEYNTERLLAVIAMLELNLADLLELERGGSDAT